MFTEIIFGAGFRLDTPKSVIDAIKLCIHGKVANIVHPFFITKCGTRILCNGGSMHFPGTIKTKFWKDRCDGKWYLHFRTNFKNDSFEIEDFLDWVKPYLGQGSGVDELYAIVTRQDKYAPSLYYLHNR